MSAIAPQSNSAFKEAVNHVRAVMWIVARAADQLLAARRMATTDKSDTVRIASISVTKAAAAIAKTSGKDPAAIERFLKEKLTKQTHVLKMIRLRNPPNDFVP